MATIPKCKLFSRHQWGFVKNIWEHRITLRSASATKRGVYRCDCGEAKIGQPGRTPSTEESDAALSGAVTAGEG